GSTRARPGPLRDRLRKVLGEEVALVWSTPMPAKEALDITTLRANEAAPSVDESIAQVVSGKVKRRK
ncbi:MAG: hypothetical protein WAX67_13785, partial [Rugosibacter sp.]